MSNKYLSTYVLAKHRWLNSRWFTQFLFQFILEPTHPSPFRSSPLKTRIKSGRSNIPFREPLPPPPLPSILLPSPRSVIMFSAADAAAASFSLPRIPPPSFFGSIFGKKRRSNPPTPPPFVGQGQLCADRKRKVHRRIFLNGNQGHIFVVFDCSNLFL